MFERRLSERQVDWDLDRNVVAGECLHGTARLSYWWFEHTNTEQCAHAKRGGLKKRTEAGSEVLMHDCVSVCSAHCYSLCFVSRFSTTGFSTFLPFPLFMQTDLRLFETELYSRCFEWHN